MTSRPSDPDAESHLGDEHDDYGDLEVHGATGQNDLKMTSGKGDGDKIDACAARRRSEPLALEPWDVNLHDHTDLDRYGDERDDDNTDAEEHDGDEYDDYGDRRSTAAPSGTTFRPQAATATSTKSTPGPPPPIGRRPDGRRPWRTAPPSATMCCGRAWDRAQSGGSRSWTPHTHT
jgi:hypothetical protein